MTYTTIRIEFDDMIQIEKWMRKLKKNTRAEVVSKMIKLIKQGRLI